MTIYFHGSLACDEKDLKSRIDEYYPEFSSFFLQENVVFLKGGGDLYVNGYICNHVSGLESQCGIVVAHDWTISTSNNDIILKHFDNLKSVCKAMGYSRILVTMPIRMKNTCKLLEQNGFVSIHTFDNRRSGNTNNVYICEL